MTTIIANIEKLTEIMTTTHDEDKQFLNEVKEEIYEQKMEKTKRKTTHL